MKNTTLSLEKAPSMTGCTIEEYDRRSELVELLKEIDYLYFSY